jgi:large subunit ribosomal protein L29
MPKTNQIVDLRKMSTVDLIKLGEEKRAELFALKFQAVLGSLEQTHRIKSIKKEIARVELVLTEKKQAGENINQVVKADYSKAVEAADKAGKSVRKKQLKQMQEAYGISDQDLEPKAEKADEEKEVSAKPKTEAKKTAAKPKTETKKETKTSKAEKAAPKKESSKKEGTK